MEEWSDKENWGTISFVQGQLLVRFEYQVRGSIARSAVALFNQAKDLVQTMGTVSLSAAHQAAVMDAVHILSYYFRMLLSRAGEQVLRRLSYLSLQ
jgi:hypothetical protein